MEHLCGYDGRGGGRKLVISEGILIKFPSPVAACALSSVENYFENKRQRRFWAYACDSVRHSSPALRDFLICIIVLMQHII
jgi:hypothetical protein